jgi:hypothetical protein
VCMCVVYYIAGVSVYSRVNVVCVCVCVCGILHSGCQCV